MVLGFPPPRRRLPYQPGQPQSQQGGDPLDPLVDRRMQQMNRPQAPAAPAGGDDLDGLVNHRMAQGGGQMTAQQNGGGGPFSGVNNSNRQYFGRGGPSSANRGFQPNTSNLGNNLGQAPSYAPAPGQGVSTTNAPPPVTAASPPAGAPPSSSSSDDPYSDDPNFDSLVDLRRKQDQDYKAEQGQLAADRAHALQQIGAQSGLGGMGLSGASVTNAADAGRQQDRNAELTLGQLRQQQEDERFKNVARNAILDELNAPDGGNGNGQGSPPGPYQPDTGAGPGKSSTGGNGWTDWVNGLGSFVSGHGWNEGDSVAPPSGPAVNGGSYGPSSSSTSSPANASNVQGAPTTTTKDLNSAQDASQPGTGWVAVRQAPDATYYYDPSTKKYYRVPKGG